ncbi:uncharacterized protein [Temnothorax longispinosus]|uniref:uncharacterized protein n=1 Tax=Temnothorax longispinosus TaxID=300112 RepID=UPI003A9A0AF5
MDKEVTKWLQEKDLCDLKEIFENENWKQLLLTDTADSFSIKFVIKNNDTKAVIFIDKNLTELLIKEVNEKLTIFVDGTFTTVPQLQNNNCQLWTIIIKHNNRTFPIVYTIMEGRTTDNYIDVLRKVTNVVKIAPDLAIADFEKAEQKALQTIFPNVKVIGCFFHYSQALVHNADKHKILNPFQRPKKIGLGATKLLISLAFLPEQLVEEGFKIIDTIIFDDCKYLQSFFNYYRDTWLNGFKPSLFCIFKKLHRTNNVSERHNRKLRESLNKHSRCVEFLGIL